MLNLLLLCDSLVAVVQIPLVDDICCFTVWGTDLLLSVQINSNLLEAIKFLGSFPYTEELRSLYEVPFREMRFCLFGSKIAQPGSLEALENSFGGQSY